ncbi:MAG: 1-(5-phosphoribosyl)-5-((5-phosphoribosylamino)methylideneamino)imidazole-4-carboxamide isomerase [Candidatus Parabeggiatoa sp. nov. 1]|nr:MAG: 1-(5-phosphoribosyl)-5-((5-phosphoribosylamino)methylideneamino)imidazole-4-carboxamide isomerase [Gammaproteobacteria bacterium]HEC85482.1 DUF971 domain-containing protein [Thioploca sp.]
MAKNIPTPTEINLHQKSRLLEITFDDGEHFELTCEFLRVYSPSAEVRGHAPGDEVLQIGKADVNIEKIDPVGTYAVVLRFDDGHDTGIYSWDWLYHIGKNHDKLWQTYLEQLEKAGQKRAPTDTNL